MTPLQMPVDNDHSLSDWYAQPLTVQEAAERLASIRAQRKQNSSASSLRIEEIIARFWLGRDIKGDVDNYLADCEIESNEALITLVYGQLLMSRKCKGAMDYLHAGLRMASRHFQDAAYLEVMRRHELLNFIVLSNQPSRALTLQELLREAAVIKKLKGKKDYHCDIRSDKTDTVG